MTDVTPEPCHVARQLPVIRRTVHRDEARSKAAKTLPIALAERKSHAICHPSPAIRTGEASS
jgi:hypothetical protein